MNRDPCPPSKQFGDFVFGKTLGQGTFGKVILGRHKITGENAAIKVLEKSKISDTSDTERVLREIHILKLMRHPNIVQLYDIGETNKKLFLFMEYMENGELFNYIVENERLREDQACRLFHQLIDGIEHLHQIGIVHRDLKPENLLLDYRKNLRIVDFGLSNTYKKNEKLKTPCGSPCYAAPEMLNGQPYEGLKIDIWSSGVILFAMLCGCMPFEDNDNTSLLYKKILKGDYKVRESLSEPAKDLIKKILCVDVNKRLTIEQIRSHPWMTINCPNRNPPQGIVVGFNKIPTDPQVLNSLKDYGYDVEYTRNCLEANRHNKLTTTYYLSLKKFIKNGGTSNCDLASPHFDFSRLDPANQRRKEGNRNNQLLIDSLFTGHGKEEGRKRPKDIKSKSLLKSKNKENRVPNDQSLQKNVASERPSQTKKIRVSKLSQLENSMNYGRPSSGKSSQKPRQGVFENRINRKYKEKFNQSLVSKSKSKERISQQVSHHAYFQPKIIPKMEHSVAQSRGKNDTMDLKENKDLREVQGRKKSLSKKLVSQPLNSSKARWM